MVNEHVEDDTIKLLKECNAGVKTAVTSIDEVLDKVESNTLLKMLKDNKEAHEKLGNKTHELLNQYHDSEKDPNPIAKAMSWMKINMKLAANEDDTVIANLMTDGCDMGVKSLTQYVNKYPAANEQVKGIAKELIELEEQLRKSLQDYL